MAYLFIYSDDEKKIYTGAQRFINHMRDVDVSWCSTEEIIVTLNVYLSEYRKSAVVRKWRS